jgi:hypothetical protein
LEIYLGVKVCQSLLKRSKGFTTLAFAVKSDRIRE